MRGEFLDLDGARVYYYAAGSRGAGEPIVLVHGFPTSGHLWSAVVPALPAGHRVVVVDLLGFGRSDPPQGHDVGVGAHADRLVCLLDELGIDQACLVGHDIGGAVVQAVLVHHGQRVSRAGLVNAVAYDAWPGRIARFARTSMGLVRHLPPDLLLAALRGGLRRGYVDAERGSHALERYLRPFRGEEGRAALVAHLDALDASVTQAIAPQLGNVSCPVTIVSGERDPFVPVHVGERLHADIPGSTLCVLPGARHFTPDESAHAVAGAVTELVSR